MVGLVFLFLWSMKDVGFCFFGIFWCCGCLFLCFTGLFIFFFLIIVGEKYRFLDCSVSGPFKICSLELDDSSD